MVLDEEGLSLPKARLKAMIASPETPIYPISKRPAVLDLAGKETL
jgi:hypothetical protein